MKYVVAWTARDSADNEQAQRRGLAAFAKWTPPSSQTFHQFLGRLDGNGGFAVIETDDPNSMMDGPTKFGPWFEFHIYPVTEIAELARAAGEGVEFRAGVD